MAPPGSDGVATIVGDCAVKRYEDAKDEVIPLVETFLRQHPLPSEVADGPR